MRFLLGQLGANGDCLYATILARQIKHDWPDCHLTWATSTLCAPVLKNNPHIDEVWLWQYPDRKTHDRAWWALERSILRNQLRAPAFDRVWLSQIWPGNFRLFDGTVGPSILRAYGAPITVPRDPTIILSDEEIDEVRRFAAANGIEKGRPCIVFECSFGSSQSNVTPAYALAVAENLRRRRPNCLVVLSTHEKLPSLPEGVCSAGTLSIRQHAALTSYCDIWVGCGSALSLVATTSASQTLPIIQLLRRDRSVFGSFYNTSKIWGLPVDRFIERSDATVEEAAAVIESILDDGLPAARTLFHEPVPVHFAYYKILIRENVLRKGFAFDAVESLALTVRNFGWSPELRQFATDEIFPQLGTDATVMDTKRRERVEQLWHELTSS